LLPEEELLDTVTVLINNFNHLPLSSLWTIGKAKLLRIRFSSQVERKSTKGYRKSRRAPARGPDQQNRVSQYYWQGLVLVA